MCDSSQTQDAAGLFLLASSGLLVASPCGGRLGGGPLAENRLVSVSGAVTASFVYDGDGTRVKSTIAGTTTYFVGNICEVSGSTVTKYYYLGGSRVAMRQGSNVYYLLNDHLGSTTVTTDVNGAAFAELRYKPWGEVRYTGGTTPTKYTYAGQYSNTSDFGLMFYNARWYDPSLGRFTSADSMVPPGLQGYDRYAHTNNNPINYTDPTGYFGKHRDDKSDYCNKRNQQKVKNLEQKREKEKALKALVQATNKEMELDPSAGAVAAAFGGGKPMLGMVGEGQEPPIAQRLSTALFMMPVFLALDLSLVGATLVVSAALAADPEPITKAALLVTEIGISAIDVGVVYAEVSYVHWIVTGTGIDSWSDLQDWQVRP